jgi:hypothetical protein
MINVIFPRYIFYPVFYQPDQIWVQNLFSGPLGNANNSLIRMSRLWNRNEELFEWEVW